MAKKKNQVQSPAVNLGVQHRKTLWKQMKSRWQIYLLLLLPLIYIIIFA